MFLRTLNLTSRASLKTITRNASKGRLHPLEKRAFETVPVTKKDNFSVGVILERFPFIHEKQNAIEESYFLFKTQFDRATLAPGLDEVAESLRAPAAKKEEGGIEMDEPSPSETTAAMKAEDVFVAEPRETVADKENNMKSVYRKIDQYLYLILQNENSEWEFPKAPFVEEGVEEPLSVRQNAENCLLENVKLRRHFFFSNAPSAAIQKKKETIFLYKAQFESSDIILQRTSKYLDYKWISKDEFEEYLSPECHKVVSKFLL